MNRDIVLKNFFNKLKEAKSQNVRDVRLSLKEMDDLGYILFELTSEFYDKVMTSSNKVNKQNDEVINNKYLILKYPYNNSNENMAVNYEDSNWFGILSIRKFLESLKIKVTPYIINGVEIIPVPKAFIYSLDYIEILDFDFYDDEFKNNLYKEINKAFIKNLL